MSVCAAGYLRIASADPAAWMDFGTNVLGLMDAQRTDAAGARFLRMDDHPFRFMIEPGAADKLLAVGLEYPGAASWQAALDALAGAGHAVTAGIRRRSAAPLRLGFRHGTGPCGQYAGTVLGPQAGLRATGLPHRGQRLCHHLPADRRHGLRPLRAARPGARRNHGLLHTVPRYGPHRYAVPARHGGSQDQLYARQQPAPALRWRCSMARIRWVSCTSWLKCRPWTKWARP